MKVAYLTVLNPIASGISDFSEELLMAFNCPDIELDIFIDNYKIENKDIQENYNIYKIQEFDKLYHLYDKVIYQIGNNEKGHESIYKMALKHKGIVELHDVSLHHMIAGMTVARGNQAEYTNIMKYCHGDLGYKAANEFLSGQTLPPWETNSMEFPVNKNIVDSAEAIIVHSDYARQLVKGIAPTKIVYVIYLHTPDLYEDYKNEKISAREELKISKEDFLIGSFGFATKEKRILQILHVLAILKKENVKFKYYIVGKCSDNLDIDRFISDNNLSSNVVITGFVPLDRLKKFMLACDMCFNLRYPTQGESSAILHRLMGMGKCICVTDIGSFKEYGDILIKINPNREMEDITSIIKLLYTDRNELKKYESKTFKFALDECNLKKNIEKYIDIIYGKTDVIIEDLVVDKLFELGIYDIELVKKMITTL